MTKVIKKYRRKRLVKKLYIKADEIIATICRETGLTRAELLGCRRYPSLVAARNEAMYRIRQDTCLSTTEIGNFFGKNHATVIHAIKQHQQWLDNDDTQD